MVEQSTQAQSVIEAKLTKSEAIEIIVADMVKDLERAKANIKAELDRLGSFPLTDIDAYILDARVKVYTYGKIEGDEIGLSLDECRVSLRKMPLEFKARIKRINELVAQRDEVSEKLHRLTSDKQSSKVQLLKTILEGTPEGQAWLKQLEVLRHAAAKRLGVSADVKLLAGKL